MSSPAGRLSVSRPSAAPYYDRDDRPARRSVMPIGPIIRRCFGPLERPVTDLYRACFVNLGRFVRLVAEVAPGARDILEVGCGEGAVLERLAQAYPEARLTGIDITPKVGRLFRGDRSRVNFRQETIQQFAAEPPGRFDLVVISDVVHHVPWEMHTEFLREAFRPLRPGGVFVLKDWERRRNLIHPIGYFSDRVLTGDTIRYRTAAEFRELIAAAVGPGRIVREDRIPPWPNNLVFTLRAPGDGGA
jgi:2-polyprenyl-6-hydroxyphenyl methylase/3-demethylubiquinone-9 3-methyltransferase